MNRLYLIRHSISIGNENEIIQGNIDYNLSEMGKKKLYNLDCLSLKNVKRIYSSPYKRTLETSKIIKKKLKINCRILIDKDLIEKSAGILNGKSKEYLRKYKKELLDIYLKRADYDAIPYGETWKYTQARVLSFLEKYFEKDNECDLIVSHAAYMRMFLNTINFKYRNAPEDLHNACIHIVDDPLKNIGLEKILTAKSSKVYKITTYDNKYILKKISGEITYYDYSINKVLINISKHINVPNPIYMSDKKNYYIKIYDYIEGEHIFGKLNEKLLKKMFNEVYKMHTLLIKYSKKNDIDMFRINDIISDMFYIKEHLKSDKYKRVIESLIYDDELNIYLDNTEYILVHNDLHRYNIIIDDGNIGFLDFDGLKLCPKLLQVSSFISTCFLLEDNTIEIEKLVTYWPEKVNISIVKKLIIYRLLYGLSFFDGLNKLNDFDKEIREKYIKAIERCIYEKNCYTK